MMPYFKSKGSLFASGSASGRKRGVNGNWIIKIKIKLAINLSLNLISLFINFRSRGLVLLRHSSLFHWGFWLVTENKTDR
jgi:hypothetical protein